MLFIAVMLFLLLTPASAFAFNFTVNNTTDAVDATPGDGICLTGGAVCTLRAAIQESNAWPGPDTITIPAGTYTFSIAGVDDSAASGDLDIYEAVVIRGNDDTTTTVNANDLERVFDIHSVDVTIEHLSMINGRAANSEGGGIRIIEGDLTLRHITLDSNETTGTGFGGGGVYTNTGSLIIDDATITNNRSSRGGGVFHFSRDMAITNSRINSNLADLGAASGGGVFTQSEGPNIISNTTINGNNAALGGGGGVYAVFGATITNSTISNNVSGQVGGGGVYDIGIGTLTITNTTISGNTISLGNGGALHTRKSTAIIVNSTIYNNRALGIDNGIDTFNGHAGGIFLPKDESITLTNTIITNNTSSTGGNNCFSQTDLGDVGIFQSTTLSTISDDNTCELAGIGDAPNTGSNVASSLSSTLGTNGGPTLTHAITVGPAVDTGNVAACPGTDQRGFTRPVNGSGSAICDIGAIEYDPTGTKSDLSVKIEEDLDPAIRSSNLTYRVTVTNHGPDAATGVSLLNTLGSGVSHNSNDGGCTLSGTLNCSLGSINAGASQTVTIVTTPGTAGSISHLATVSTTATDPNSSNDSDTESTDVSTTTDLSITMTGPAAATANIQETFNITVTNSAADVATDAVVAVQFDSTMGLVSLSPSVGSCGGASDSGLAVCNLGNIAASGSATVTVYATPQLQVVGSISTTAFVSFNGVDSNMTNNTQAVATTVDADATLVVTSNDSADPAYQGADIFYTFTVRNLGPSTANNSILTVTFPAGISLSPAVGAAPAYCSGASTVSCNLTSITGGQIRTITLVAIASSSGTFSIDSTATSDETTPVLDSESTTIIASPVSPANADLSISMIDTADPVVAGGSVTYNATVTNSSGPNIAQSVAITVTLPSKFTFSSASGGCSHSNSIVTCNIGALAINSSATVSITASTSSTGVFSTLATVGDTLGNDPNLINNNVWQSTQVNSTGGNAGAASRLNSGGGGAFSISETLSLLLLLLAPIARYSNRITIAYRNP